MTNILKNNKLLDKIVNISLLIICILGIVTSFYMNSLNRSLWLDEAYLSYSFMQRNLLNMFKGELEYTQSAPLGWLYLVKIFTYIFGTSEFMLRMPSVLFYIGTLVLTYYYSKKIINLTYPLAPAALVANMPLMLRYSNEFKPYIADCFFVLLILIVFDLYLKKRISLTKLSIIWSISIWFSNPVCFFEGGLLISYFIYKCLIQKDWSEFKNILIIFFSIITSFIIYYFLWLKLTANDQAMTNYWKDNRFKLFPFTLKNIDKDKDLIIDLFNKISGNYILYIFELLIPFILSFVYSIKNKNTIQTGLYIALLISLFASSLGFFPIVDRLWLFIYPVIFIQIFYYIDAVAHKIVYKEFINYVVLTFVVFNLFVLNSGIYQYLSNRNNTYRKNEEFNTEIDYLYDNAKNGDVIYVRYDNIPNFKYKNGYSEDYLNVNNNKIKIVYGDINCMNDISTIVNFEKVYIVSSHNGDDFYEFIDSLKIHGNIEIVNNSYGTPLYMFLRQE